MFKALVLSSALACVGILGVAAVESQAAPDEASATNWRGRWADTPLGRLFMGRIGRAMTLRAELNVTAEQKAEIRAMLKDNRGEMAKAAKPVVESRRKLVDAVLAEKTDDAAIRAAADQLGKDIGEAAVKAAPLAAKLRGVMTEEQRKLIREFRADNAAAVDKFFEKLAQ
jgi:Spy/CpxP family protein refolding chaperone